MAGGELRASFDFGDDRARRAAREFWRAEGARLLDRPAALAVAAGTGLFAWALLTPASPLWWRLLTGSVPALAAFAAAVWLGVYLWLPRQAVRKLAHLPHRRVEVVLTEAAFSVRTATERLDLAWSEVVEVRLLSGFAFIKPRSGEPLPLPREALGPVMEAELLSRAHPPASRPS